VLVSLPGLLLFGKRLPLLLVLVFRKRLSLRLLELSFRKRFRLSLGLSLGLSLRLLLVLSFRKCFRLSLPFRLLRNFMKFDLKIKKILQKRPYPRNSPEGESRHKRFNSFLQLTVAHEGQSRQPLVPWIFSFYSCKLLSVNFLSCTTKRTKIFK
jgi:hypothetical protein